MTNQKKKFFPKIKKKLKWFLTDESWKITKKDAFGLAAGAVLLSGIEEVSAGHSNNPCTAHSNAENSVHCNNSVWPYNIDTTAVAHSTKYWSHANSGWAHSSANADPVTNQCYELKEYINKTVTTHSSWIVNWHYSWVPNWWHANWVQFKDPKVVTADGPQRDCYHGSHSSHGSWGWC